MLLELLAADRPLVVLLDDLHWCDGASVELLGALLRRGPDARVLLALASRPTQAPARLSATLGVAGCDGSGSVNSARRRRRSCWASSIRDPRRRSTSTAAAIPLSRAARARGGSVTLAGPVSGAGVDGFGVPRAVTASLAEELTSLSATERGLLEAAAVAGERSSPIWQRRLPSCQLGMGSLRWMRCSRVIFCARRRSRGGLSFATRSYEQRSMSPPRVVGGSRHTRGRRRSWRRGAPRRASGQSRRAIGRAGKRGGDRAPARGGCSCRDARSCRCGSLVPVDAATAARIGRRTAGRRPRGARLGAPRRRRAGAMSGDAAGSDRATPRRREGALGRVDGFCAAIEHWLGRHEEAHQRLTRAWDDLPDRSTPAAAVLQIELAVDGLYELDFERTAKWVAKLSPPHGPSVTGR